MKLRRGTVRIAGMTKGSGMIHPRMATTLGFVMTDANIPVAKLRGILTRATERSYNRISVDGDTSTNDTVVLLANGCSGVRPDPKEFAAFEEGVATVMETLAQQIARDGEGARKLVTIDVAGAATEDAAARIARAIANSPLVKTAIAGSDPNWGRILSAAGNAGVAFDPAKVDIEMQGVTVCRGGLAARFSEASSSRSSINRSARSISRFAARARAARASGPAISPKVTFVSMPATAPEIARRAFLAALVAPLFADTRQEIIDLFTTMASALSEGNGLAFLDHVDHAMPDYGKLEKYILALAAQNEVMSSIDVLKEEGDDHTADGGAGLVSCRFVRASRAGRSSGAGRLSTAGWSGRRKSGK